MADIFVDNAGSNTSPFDTWAKAATTLAGALAIATDADTIYVANTHSASQTTAKTLICPSSPGLRILCVTPSGAAGNSGLATGAVEAVGAGNVAISIYGFAYIYGLTIQGATNNSSAAVMNVASIAVPCGLYLDTCRLESRTASGGGFVFLGPPAATGNDDVVIALTNCTFQFGATGQAIGCRTARNILINTGIDSAGATPTTLLVGTNGCHGSLLWEASDLSGVTWANAASVAWTSVYDVTLRNCKMPSGWAASTGTHTGPGGVVVKAHNCDAGDVHTNFVEMDYAGTVIDETTIVRTGGGAISARMDSSANARFPYLPLTFEGAIYNDTLSARTLTVEVIHSGVGGGTSGDFLDSEVWLEVIHPGTSGYPQGVLDIDDRAADALASGADQPNSSETWASSPATPVKQYLQCSFTPAEVGYVHFKVCLAAPSKTVYVDAFGATLA